MLEAILAYLYWSSIHRKGGCLCVGGTLKHL